MAIKMNIIPNTIITLFGLFWTGTLVHGQSQKRALQESEYNKWSTLQNEVIAPDGNWIGYSLHYEEAPDTLFVKNTKTGKEFIFPKASSVTFSNDSQLAAVKLENGLLLRELKGGKALTINSVLQFEFYRQGPYIVLLTGKEKNTTLKILNYSTQEQFDYKGVKSFSISNDGKIAMNTGNKVTVVIPKEQCKEATMFEDVAGEFKNLQWNKTGNILAFLQPLPKDSLMPQNHRIYCYNLVNKKQYVLDPSTHAALGGQRIMVRIGTPAVLFSEEEENLLFAAAQPRKPITKEKIEVWDSATPLEYTPNRYNGNNKYEPKLHQWDFRTNQIKAIGTVDKPKVIRIKNSPYALVGNPLQYEPQYAYHAPMDIYLKNIATGKETLLLQKVAINSSLIGNSPNGNFIHYFAEGSWFVYDIERAAHINVSTSANTSFEHPGKSDRGKPKAYGCAGWSADSRYLIVYDEYGVWLLANDGKSAKRVVDGTIDKIRYRVYKKLYETGDKISVDEFKNYSFDLSKGLVLEAMGNDMQSGYFIAQANGSLKKLIYEPAGIDRLLKANDSHTYLCVKQAVDTSPQLVLMNKNAQGAKTIVTTNPQMHKYHWGSATLVNYKNKQGVPLKGILYKPAGFIVGKKYPMIVLIYENQSQGLHTYHNPTKYDVTGFALANYFLDDYLILLPDIVYEQGNPGLSAVDCVLSAVNAVKQLGIVQENHIGLIGHSFGGYETSFIITQTNTFAAAVSGAGVMDLIGSYFTHTSIGPRSNTWRYEEQQFRIHSSPYENWEAYERNSPLKNAVNINTPLLSWAGKEDGNVLWTQSATFHLALRRLGKRNVFLVYEGEEHTIVNSENQIDLTKRTKNWFDYYLKDKKEALTNGLP